MLIPELPETQVNTSGEEEDEHLEIVEKGWPCRRLMLGYGGNDGNYRDMTALHQNEIRSDNKVSDSL